MPLAALVLGGIDIKDANIHWHDMQQEVEYKISDANIATGELKLGEPIDITACFKCRCFKTGALLRDSDLPARSPMRRVAMS